MSHRTATLIIGAIMFTGGLVAIEWLEARMMIPIVVMGATLIIMSGAKELPS